MELQKAIELFLNNQKASTRESYSYPMKLFIGWMGALRTISEIKTVDLLEYQHKCLQTRNYAPATERKHVKTLKTFFNWLVDIDVLEKSPARVLKVKRLALYVERDKAMTDDELAQLLAYMKYKPRDYALLLFLADTGCRISGAAGLQVTDLDLEKRWGRVTEKGDKTRNVHFGDLCAIAIAKWLLKRPRSAGPYVFSRTKTAMKADNISLMLRRACQKLDIRVLSGHTLRHRKGHQLADNHVAPSIAATALGHSDPVITLQHYYPADWATAQAELAKVVTTEELKPRESKTIIDLNATLKRAT